jgi:ATP-dependent helicase/nuclease subunit A
MDKELTDRLIWQYPYQQASAYFSKTSVSEMKRMEGLAKMEEIAAREDSGILLMQDESRDSRTTLLRRPRFMEEKKITATERGTVYHAVMQHIPLDPLVRLTRPEIDLHLEQMVNKQLLTREQRAVIDSAVIASFFESDTGMKLQQSDDVQREVPFSFGLSASEVYPEADPNTAEETVMIQGVIDCLFDHEGELILLDYKTDAVYGERIEEIAAKYRLQMDLYARAVEGIWNRPVREKILFLFDGAHIVRM